MNESNPGRRQLLLAGVAGLVAQFVAPDAGAQDAARVMPHAYRVAFENDRLRVLDFTGRPGMGICGDSMHTHPAHLTVVLTGWEGLVTMPDGHTERVQRKPGDVFWSEAVTHKVENTGRSTSRVLIIELKSPAAKA